MVKTGYSIQQQLHVDVVGAWYILEYTYGTVVSMKVFLNEKATGLGTVYLIDSFGFSETSIDRSELRQSLGSSMLP